MPRHRWNALVGTVLTERSSHLCAARSVQQVCDASGIGNDLKCGFGGNIISFLQARAALEMQNIVAQRYQMLFMYKTKMSMVHAKLQWLRRRRNFKWSFIYATNVVIYRLNNMVIYMRNRHGYL